MRITLCGSMAFARQMAVAKEALEGRGHVVFAGPLLDRYARGELVHQPGMEAERKKAHDLIRAHFRKIEESDAILVLNYEKQGIPGYISGNTLMEMGYAFYLGKRIFLLNPIPDSGYRDEIVAMEPTVLESDLSRIA